MKKCLIICTLIPCCLLSLSAYAVDYFTEEFNGFDMDGHSVTFTPTDSPSGYSANAVLISALPVDPTGHTQIPLIDDDSIEVSVTGGEQVTFYSEDYSWFYIGSNGYITFGTTDDTYSSSLSNHFARARISAVYDDLNPATGGEVTWDQQSDRMVVTYNNVPEFGTTNTNTFQIEMFFDERIRISWLNVDAEYFIAGLSDGSGIPVDFVESDFSDYAGDTDGDGLPNDWELLYFNDPTLADPLVDSDFDGHNNLAEYISGMNPTNPVSVFRVSQQSLPAVGGGTQCILNWTAVEGREYAIHWNDDLVTGDFSNLLLSGITYPVSAYTTIVEQAQSRRFFKMDVQLVE